ncbi:MAG: hypothetical protein KAS94_07670 [Desulfobulbaceae bacterium]|nr:hypothetical protein [Desulfobulbaceae bacterium]
MLQFITLKRLWVGLAVIVISSVFGVQNTFATENVGLAQASKSSVTNPSTIKQSTGDSRNEELFNLKMRIESLERQIAYMGKRLDRNMMSGVMLRDTKELANDAWTLAVEARAIAVRAESKADQAPKNIKR